MNEQNKRSDLPVFCPEEARPFLLQVGHLWYLQSKSQA